MNESDKNLSFKEPNGSAFVTTETRTGPPLSFLADKLYQALVYTHKAYQAVKCYIPDDFPQPQGWQSADFSVKGDALLEPIRNAFRSQLTAFLGLYNMLALDTNPGLIERLLQMPTADLRAWLGRMFGETSAASASRSGGHSPRTAINPWEGRSMCAGIASPPKRRTVRAASSNPTSAGA